MSQSGRRSSLGARPELMSLEGRRLLAGNPLVRVEFAPALVSLANLNAANHPAPVFVQGQSSSASAATIARIARAEGGAAFAQLSLSPTFASAPPSVFVVAAPAGSAAVQSPLNRGIPASFGTTTALVTAQAVKPVVVVAAPAPSRPQFANPVVAGVAQATGLFGANFRLVGNSFQTQQFGVATRVV